MAVLRSMRSTGIILLAAAHLFIPSVARGDGGTLRYSKRIRGLDISVFTDPTPVRTGTLDVSVYVRPVPSEGRRALPAFEICAYPVAAPAKRQRQIASDEVATNKLFKAARLELTQPGLWQVEVNMDSAEGLMQAAFQLPVEEGYPRWTTYALWIGLPAGAVLLFFAHGRLVRRRERAKMPQAISPSQIG